MFECVAIPANALYHANTAAVMPQAPPALIKLIRGSLSSRARYATARIRKVPSRATNVRKNIRLVRRVHNVSITVKIVQP